VVASILYIVPQVYGMEANDQALFGAGDSPLISTANLALARPILWISLGLVAVTGGAVFTRFMMRLGLPADGEASTAEPEAKTA